MGDTAETGLTGLVAVLNEEKKLPACLQSLRECGDLIVVDLGSSDKSASVAEAFGARLLRHERVPVVEMLWPSIVCECRNSWIIRVDPDEVLPPLLLGEIWRMIASVPDAGMLRLPHRFYFRGRPLHTTRWGCVKSSPKVFHRDRVTLTGNVHAGIVCKPGFREITLPPTDDNLVAHYWADSWAELIAKHRRYLTVEGKARFDRGERFGWPRLAGETMAALRFSLLTCRGWRGGMDGLSLSGLHAWYTFMSLLSLRRYQRAQGRLNAEDHN